MFSAHFQAVAAPILPQSSATGKAAKNNKKGIPLRPRLHQPRQKLSEINRYLDGSNRALVVGPRVLSEVSKRGWREGVGDKQTPKKSPKSSPEICPPSPNRGPKTHPKSRNTKKTPCLHELFRKVRVNFWSFPVTRVRNPAQIVQKNLFG